MTPAATFTVVGQTTGRPYACGVASAAAAAWMQSYGAGEVELATLLVGEAWSSHGDTRGIRVTRVS